MANEKNIRTEKVWLWARLARVFDTSPETLERRWSEADGDSAIRTLIRWCDVRDKPYAYVRDLADHFGLPDDWMPEEASRRTSA